MRVITLVSAAAMLAACSSTTPQDHTAEIHADHPHQHVDGDGHVKVKHGDHWDFLHDGHLHFVHDGHVDEHVLEVSDINPADENPLDPALHADHMHGDGDKHLTIRHGDHIDYIHNGRLHYVHGDHVDDHGPITIDMNG